MKILFTVHSYYPNQDGVQMATQSLAERLAAAGHEIIVLTSISSGVKKQEIINGVHVQRIDLHTRYSMYWGNKGNYFSLVQEFCQQIDVMVNVCTQNAFTDLLLPHLHKLPCKKILYMHGMHDFRWKTFQLQSLRAFVNKVWKDIKWGWLYFRNKNNFFQYDTIVHLHSLDYAYNFFKKHFGLDGFILENAVDDRFWEGIESEVKNSYFICVANYFVDKNQKFLLEGFYKSKASKNHELILVGGKPTKYYSQLLEYEKKLQKIYGKRKVHFRYQVSRQETVALIKHAYLYLFSSFHEVYPISIIEAMTSKIPFISTDVGCVRALPGGMMSFSPDDMAVMIDLLVEDPKLASEFGQAGYQYACEHFKMVNQLQKFQELLDSIVKH